MFEMIMVHNHTIRTGIAEAVANIGFDPMVDLEINDALVELEADDDVDLGDANLDTAADPTTPSTIGKKPAPSPSPSSKPLLVKIKLEVGIDVPKEERRKTTQRRWLRLKRATKWG